MSSLMLAASCCAAISKISFALRSRSVDHLNDDANNDDDDMEANRGNFQLFFFSLLFCSYCGISSVNSEHCQSMCVVL